MSAILTRPVGVATNAPCTLSNVAPNAYRSPLAEREVKPLKGCGLPGACVTLDTRFVSDVPL